MATQQKVWFKSITLWFNVALILIASINQIATYIPIPAEIMAYVAMAGNILLRFKTTSQLTK